jgi:tRNA(adenine34) deaminase
MTHENDDIRWMEHALALAERGAEEGEVPVGAVLISGGEILGEGWNRPISLHDPTAHAEIIAMRAAARKLANYRLAGSTLYVTLEPCLMCAGAIVHARVARLVFGAHDPKRGAIDSTTHAFEAPGLNHRPEIVGGVLEQRCGGCLQAFFRARRT